MRRRHQTINSVVRAPVREAAWPRGWRWLLIVALWASLGASRCGAQAGMQREYELKAGVLYHIIKYVEWPVASRSNTPPTLQIGLLGRIPHAEAIEVLDGKTVQGRRLVVKRLAAEDEARHCQVLFIGASEKPRLAEIVSGTKSLPILTVGEVEGFAEHGGMVNLVEQQNRIAMEINREVASQAGLSISSQLLKLAKVFP